MNWGVWDKNLSTTEMVHLINLCIENKITTFDHADIYGGYTTEAAFGKALNESKVDRKNMQLITKCGIEHISENRPNNIVKHYDYSKEYIIWSVENSLKNLHTDYLTSGFTSVSDVTALSDHFIEDGSFFKIDNISIGYTAKQISKGVDARFYGSLQNVAVFTNFSGIDPEIPSGIDNNFYPRPRSFMFGVNFNF